MEWYVSPPSANFDQFTPSGFVPDSGTGIDLIGSVVNALYNVTLDGGVPFTQSVNSTNDTLVSFNDLENTNHTLLLTTIITDTATPASLTFDKARIAYTPPTGLVK